MATAPPNFFDPAHIQLSMPNAFPVPPPPPPYPRNSSASSKSNVLEVLKILVGLIIALILGAILAGVLLVPRTSDGVDSRESNEKIAELLRKSNEDIARLQREQMLSIEKERLKFEENLIEKHRAQDRILEQQRYERQLFGDNQRLERQLNSSETHHAEDRLIQLQRLEQELTIAMKQSKQQLDIEEQRLHLLVEEHEIAEQHRKEDLSKENNDLLSKFMQEMILAVKPFNLDSIELKVHSLIRRFDWFHKSLLIRFLYKMKLLYTKPLDDVTLNLQGADLKKLALNDMSEEFGQINHWLNYTQLSLPSTSLINASLEQAYLNEANFSHCNMTGASLRSSHITQGDFNGAILSLATFQDANVSQSLFSYTKIHYAMFRSANLSQARMDRSSFKGTNFQDVIAIQTDFFRSEIASTEFDSANLFQARLVDVSAPASSFHTAKAIQADFSFSYMPECIFQWADLTDASFRTTFLAGANFENANVVNVDFTGAFLAGAKITEGQLDVALSIAGATLPNGSVGKNKNLIRNGDVKCPESSSSSDNWISNEVDIVQRANMSTECAFQAKKINATLQQKIDLSRYERMILNGETKIYLEMQVIASGALDPSKPSAYMSVHFMDSNNIQIGLEQSTLNIARFSGPSTFIASIPCPWNTVGLQLMVVFREAHAMVDNIYITIE